jgi:pimeloyl-ACP methyl ester carboxylesterase
MNMPRSTLRRSRASRIFKILIGILVLIGILLAAAYAYFDMEDATLDDAARSQASGQFIHLPDGVTHYEFAGPEGTPIVVLVHGFSVPSYIWDPTAEALREAGFRVLRYDLYGRGYSDRPDAAYDQAFLAKQLDDLLSALGIDEPVQVAGLSMGGPVAATFVSGHPDRASSLILVDPQIMPPTEAAAKVVDIPWVGEYLMATAILPLVIAPSQSGDFHRPERVPPDWEERYRVQMRYKGFRRALLASIRNLINKDEAMPAYEAVGRQGTPVLLLWGAEDETIPREHIDQLRLALPNAEFHVIEDAGHLPHYERPEVVNPLLFSFLRASAAK